MCLAIALCNPALSSTLLFALTCCRESPVLDLAHNCHQTPLLRLPFSQSPSSYSTQNPGSTSILDDSYEPNQSFSCPGSAEMQNQAPQLNLRFTQALRRLEEQLSLNEENFEEIAPFYNEHETARDSNPQHHQGVIDKQEKSVAFSGPDDQGLFYNGYIGRQGNVNILELLRM
ncbi:Calmodulin-binding transcription activator 4 [Sesbania bispinosa]|nr:Calmodulin-binding transcription activator 4 [Sesbania bispinosa]